MRQRIESGKDSGAGYLFHDLDDQDDLGTRRGIGWRLLVDIARLGALVSSSRSGSFYGTCGRGDRNQPAWIGAILGSSPGMATPQLQHLTAPEATEIFDEIVDVYTTVYADSQTEEDFTNFRKRGSAQFRSDGFDLVTARLDGALVGFAFGITLREGSAWWRGLQPQPDEGFTDETGARSFAVIELVVLAEHRGQGLGHQLLDELLAGRAEERATLATDPRERAVQEMYEEWGWRKVGRVSAAPDAPVPHFDLYVLPLT